MNFARRLPIAWLIGGSGKLGLSIAERLETEYNVVGFSRREAKPDSERFLNVSIDLSDISMVRVVTNDLLDKGVPKILVFCQRYRFSTDPGSEDVVVGMNTEIFSTQAIIESLISRRTKGRFSVVVISSVNGFLINKCIPFWYHLLKVSQLHLVKYYSVNNGGLDINVNGIAVGSFLKSSIDDYPEPPKLWLKRLGQVSPKRGNLTVQEIASLVEVLVSDSVAAVNGQIVVMDGGLSNVLQETLI